MLHLILFHQEHSNGISDWSGNLAEIMKLNTHEAVEKLLKEGIENGESIQQIE